MVQLTATDVARSFSAVMNRVGAGEQIEIVRNGVPIARLEPPVPGQTISASRWRELMATAPAPDDAFAEDVAAARERIAPPNGAWPS